MSRREVFETWMAPLQVTELVGVDESLGLLVSDPRGPHLPPLRARTIVDVHPDQVGSQVVVMANASDPESPVVMGVLRGARDRSRCVTLEADGQRIVVSAATQLVLRCGQASITLTKEGKVLVHGTYLSSRSSGVNRINGGSVEIN